MKPFARLSRLTVLAMLLSLTVAQVRAAPNHSPQSPGSLVRFLHLTGIVDDPWAAARTRLPLPAEQRLVRVTEPIVARSADFHFLVPIDGLSVVPLAGTPIAQDGEQVWCTPYDNTVLVMPSTAHVKPGNTMVRLGRFEAA